jgi:hypothetical protein
MNATHPPFLWIKSATDNSNTILVIPFLPVKSMMDNFNSHPLVVMSPSVNPSLLVVPSLSIEFGDEQFQAAQAKTLTTSSRSAEVS